MSENNHKEPLDKPLMNYIILSSCLLIPVVSVAMYLLKNRLPERFAEGFIVGAVCGVGNLYLLDRLIKSTINPDGIRRFEAALSGVGIIGILTVFFFVLWKNQLSDVSMVIGISFHLIMIVIVGLLVKQKKGIEE